MTTAVLLLAALCFLVSLGNASASSASLLSSVYFKPAWNDTSFGNTTSGVDSLGAMRHRRADDTMKSKMAKVVKLVDMAKLQDCVGRVICDLNCNPDAFGKDGRKVFNLLLAIQTSGALQEAEMRFYLNAGMEGRKFKQANTCDQCSITYANCLASSADLVDISSLINLDA